jgi:hypothetical protein
MNSSELKSIATEVLGAVVRVGVEIVVELVFHGTGRALLSPWSSRRMSHARFTVVGFVFWLAVAASIGWALWSSGVP